MTRCFCLLLLLAAVACGPKVQPPHERFLRVTGDSFSDWTRHHREGLPDVFSVATRPPEVLWAEYQHAIRCLNAWIPLPPDAPIVTPILYLINDRETFDALSGVHGSRHLGFTDGAHVFLLRTAESDHGAALVHELAHTCIHQRFPQLPLWLEEGWATWCGDRASMELARKRLQRTEAAVFIAPGVIGDLPDIPVWDFRDYPSDPLWNAAFYDRARSVVGEVLRVEDPARWRALVEKAHQQAFPELLLNAGWPADRVEALRALALLSRSLPAAQH